MAMRLRKIGNGWVALCAAKTSAEPGDVYLDDIQDHAVRAKLSKDWRSEGLALPIVDSYLDGLADQIEASEKGDSDE